MATEICRFIKSGKYPETIPVGIDLKNKNHSVDRDLNEVLQLNIRRYQ